MESERIIEEIGKKEVRAESVKYPILLKAEIEKDSTVMKQK